MADQDYKSTSDYFSRNGEGDRRRSATYIQPVSWGANAKSQDLYSQVNRIEQDLREGGKPSGQKTIFYDMFTSDGIRPEIKTIEHLVNEARVLVIAGTVTTSHILTVLTFYVVNNPNILTRLQEELATLTKEEQSWRHLEKLPFLVPHTTPLSKYICKCDRGS